MAVIRTRTRIHPLMAAAAASVIMVSLVGTAAITGLLPSSRGANAPDMTAKLPMASSGTVDPLAQPNAVLPTAQQNAPRARSSAAPAPEHAVAHRHTPARSHTRTHEQTELARNGDANAHMAPAPAAAQPNYLGIGAGALIGGLIGNQVGGGNGKKLATVAGVIGGGMVGNEVANRAK
jgi:uncharacterized protein YcfJ